MIEEAGEKIHEQLRLVWKKFLAAFPVICFFLFLFFGVLNIFGSQYVMIVSLVTVLFQVNYKKRNSLKSLLGISVLQLFLTLLAYVATLNFPLAMILNLTVPFALIFLKSSQFNQMGYFSGLMTFTFLQLMPVDFSGFLVQITAMACGLCMFVILVLAFQARIPRTPGYENQQKGLLLIGGWQKSQAEEGETGGKSAYEESEAKEAMEELHSLEQKLYREANQKRENREIFHQGRKVFLYVCPAVSKGSVFYPEQISETGSGKRKAEKICLAGRRLSGNCGKCTFLGRRNPGDTPFFRKETTLPD